MHINFAMWRKASWELIKMDDKKEWDALDVLQVADRYAFSRHAVTVYSCITGMLPGAMDLFPVAMDRPYPVCSSHMGRTTCSTITLITHVAWIRNYSAAIWCSSAGTKFFEERTDPWSSQRFATLSGVFALYYTASIRCHRLVCSALVLLAYTYPFKYWGVGEFAIFLIWGPIMVTGVYLVLALGSSGDTANMWKVALAGVPFGLSVASINIGKHQQDER
jgi:hypothetical protein